MSEPNSELNSGPTRDPIEALENFGTGGVPVNPLEPAAVRRLGDQRRRRQHTVYGAIAAVAVAVAVIPTAILATQDDAAKPPPIGHTTAPDPTPTATPDPTPTGSFPKDGVEISSEADIAKLTGTSDAFKAFILAQYRKLEQYGQANCPDAEHGVRVNKYDPTGFALGGVNDCGGYVALWSVQNGVWKEALGTQDEWRCGDLTRFSVPDGFAGQCHGPTQVFGPAEDNGLRLGMSADQVRAAGGTVTGPGNGCQLVSPKGFTAPKDSILGYLSATPGKGVVALYAVKDQVTDRGVTVGDLKDTVTKAYPEGHLQQPQAAWYAPIDAGSYYRFDFDQGAVIRISIVANDQDCYE
jgi:hypothetical protein